MLVRISWAVEKDQLVVGQWNNLKHGATITEYAKQLACVCCECECGLHIAVETHVGVQMQYQESILSCAMSHGIHSCKDSIHTILRDRRRRTEEPIPSQP